MRHCDCVFPEERLSPPTHPARCSPSPALLRRLTAARSVSPTQPTGPAGARTSRRSTVARGRGSHPRPGWRQVAVQPLRLLRGPGRNGALPEALRPGGCGRPGQTPSPSPLGVLFQTQFQEGLQRACSKPCKRRAEGRPAFTVHDAKERRVGPAESSVEPQLCLADTCMCISTRQCPYTCVPLPQIIVH